MSEETLEEQFNRVFAENPVTERIEILKGNGYSIHVVPDYYFDTQPEAYWEDVTWEGSQCLASSTTPDTWVCTRATGHTGPHVAGFGGNTIIQVW